MDDKLVSLCMIARDAAEGLDRCLRSARPFADEILVGDTGSTDATPEVARSHGAKVLPVPWSDHFAAARNAVLEQAAGSWILVLDSDEWIEPGCEPEALRARLLGAAGEAFRVTLRDRTDHGSLRLARLVRLFRNRPEHRFEGRIHEQIVPSIARRLAADVLDLEDSPLVIGHDGYRLDERLGKDKRQRNLRLLRLDVQERPEAPGPRFFLAREQAPLYAGRVVPGSHLDEALEHLIWLEQRGFPLGGALAEEARLLFLAARVATGRADEALRGPVRDALRRGPERLLVEADAVLSAGPSHRSRTSSLVASIERVLEAGGGREPVYAWAGWNVRALLRCRAAELLLDAGRMDAVGPWIDQAAQEGPSHGEAHRVRARLHLHRGEAVEALRALGAALAEAPHNLWAWYDLGRHLLAAGRGRDALEPLGRASRLAPGWRDAEEAYAAAWLAAGRPSRLPWSAGERLPWREAAALLAFPQDLEPERAQDPEVLAALGRIERLARSR